VSIPLLSAKLSAPPIRRRLVPRLRLTERVNQGLGYKLILISAPARYGKTTLLSAWLDQCPYPATWISLEESDNDLARFLAYLVAAQQMLHGEAGQTVLAMLRSPQVISTASTLGAVLLLCGEVEPAIQAFQVAQEIGRENANLIQEVLAQCRLGQLRLLKAQLRKAEEFFKRALKLSADRQGGY
jgi:ATP/maltotriose-dependent transcriptional regulator MalT